jgi:hypothetical protein
MGLLSGPLNSSLLLGTGFQVCALAELVADKKKTRITRTKLNRQRK